MKIKALMILFSFCITVVVSIKFGSPMYYFYFIIFLFLVIPLFFSALYILFSSSKADDYIIKKFASKFEAHFCLHRNNGKGKDTSYISFGFYFYAFFVFLSFSIIYIALGIRNYPQIIYSSPPSLSFSGKAQGLTRKDLSSSKTQLDDKASRITIQNQNGTKKYLVALNPL